jgi:hypothetical protein
MLCVWSWLAPMPKIAQSYDVNLFIKMFFHFCQICKMIFLAKYIYVFELNLCTLSCNTKYTSCELIMFFGLTEIIILHLYMFSFANE